jgi:di/tricarboxylate transporter
MKTSKTAPVASVAPVLTLAALLASMPGCAVIGDIFKAGVWVGVVAIVVLVGLGFGLVSLLRGRS